MKSFSAGLALSLAATIGIAATARAVQETAAPRPNVAVLLFPGVQIIDYSAPYEVFSQSRMYNIFTVAESFAPIRTSGGTARPASWPSIPSPIIPSRTS